MQTLKYCLFLFRLNIQREVERLSGLISWGVSSAIQIIGNIFILATVVNRFGDMAGWTADQLIFMYGLSQISQGLMLFFFIQTWEIEEYIVFGKFDRMLLRPQSVLLQFLFDRTNFIGIFTIIGGLAVFLYGAGRIGLTATFFNIIQIIVVMITGTLIQAGLFMLLGCLSFYFKRTGGSTRILSNICDKTSYYPITIFPGWMQAVLTFFLPYSFIAYYPSKSILDTGGALKVATTLTGLLIGLAIFTLALVLFQYSIKKYESSGT